MVKTTTAGMDAHLPEELTTLAMAVLITRTDGEQFRFTTSSEDVDIDIGDGNGEQTYSANEGVSRTNIASDSELNVDNLDIIGIFDNAQLAETELRRGLFDFADFRIFVYNHQDTADGIIRIFRGELGEVITTTYGFFKVTLRSLVQVYSKETGEHYTKDCRADLGDIRCTMPIFPEVEGDDPTNDPFDRSFPVAYIAVSTSYQLGDWVVIPETPPACAQQIILNGEGADTSTDIVNDGGMGGDPTVIGDTQIRTDQAPAGGDSTSSINFDGSGDELQWADQPEFYPGSDPFTVQAWVRRSSTGTTDTIASQYQTSGNNRSWTLLFSSGNRLQINYSSNGTASGGQFISQTGSTVISADTDYHVAFVRKTDGDIVVFLDGNIEIGPITPSGGDPFDSTAALRVGAVGAGGSAQFFGGWIDSFEYLVGTARWEAAFTPPTGNLSPVSLPPFDGLPWSDFADRLYECTVAGSSSACIVAPDTTLTNTHVQGTATFEAHNSWMRSANVTHVVDGNRRKEFYVEELNPATAPVVGADRTLTTLGFPDDYMNGGGCHFETGVNAGVSREVVDFISDDGTIPYVTMMVPSGTGAEDIGPTNLTPTIDSEAAVQQAVTRFGPDAIEFSPTASVDPSAANVSYPDNSVLNIGSNQFTIEGWVRIKDLTDSSQVFFSKYTATSDEREWYVAREGGNIRVFLSDDGTTAAPATTQDFTFTPGWVIDTWYHIAVTRDSNNLVRVFVDGVLYGSFTFTDSVFDGTSPLFLGKFRDNGADDNPLNGFVEDFRFVIGEALYTEAFTAPGKQAINAQRIVMFDSYPFDVEVGDELRIFPGCDKLNATCISKFNNGINSVSEPYVPGEDILGQYPDAR